MRYRWVTDDTCAWEVEVVRSIDDRDVPPTPEELEAAGFGGLSPDNFIRKVEAPLLATRHIVQTGQSRLTKDPVIRDLREADKLEGQMFNLHESKRAPLQAEINKLRGIKHETR